MKATMDNAVKPPMHNLSTKTSNIKFNQQMNLKCKRSTLKLRSASNMNAKCKYFLTHKIMVEMTK